MPKLTVSQLLRVVLTSDTLEEAQTLALEALAQVDPAAHHDYSRWLGYRSAAPDADADKLKRLRETLGWALGLLDSLVSVHEDGSAYSGESGYEIVGYSVKRDNAGRVLNSLPL